MCTFFYCHNGKTYSHVFSIFSSNIQNLKTFKKKKGQGMEKKEEEKEYKVGKLNSPPPKGEEKKKI
jgi:hypothetical protein